MFYCSFQEQALGFIDFSLVHWFCSYLYYLFSLLLVYFFFFFSFVKVEALVIDLRLYSFLIQAFDAIKSPLITVLVLYLYVVLSASFSESFYFLLGSLRPELAIRQDFTFYDLNALLLFSILHAFFHIIIWMHF